MGNADRRSAVSRISTYVGIVHDAGDVVEFGGRGGGNEEGGELHSEGWT